MSTIAKLAKSPYYEFETPQKKSFGIRGKLFLGFGILTVILLVSVLISLYSISKTENFANRAVRVDLPIYHTLVDLNSELNHSYINLQMWLLHSDEKYKNLANLTNSKIQKSEDSLDNFLSTSTLSQHWQTTKALLAQYNSIQNKILNSPITPETNKILHEELLPILITLSANLNSIDLYENQKGGLMDAQYSKLNMDANELLNHVLNTKWLEYILLSIGIVASLIITLFTAHTILPALNKAINVAKQIAAGKRDINIAVHSSDEVGTLLRALKEMQQSIKKSEVKLKESENHTRNLFSKIVKSANLFSEHAGKVAAGDLRQHLNVNPNEDEEVMVQLGNDLNKMTENLSSITKEITQACHNMLSTVSEVQHAVDSQSSGASEQASSINEITASISEIEKSSMQTMEKAKALGESAERTRERGQSGLTAVDESINGMRTVREKVQAIAQTILDLSNQTQKVGEITAVVNNLAQQSKMLALNASIEAAKAGESGKGFAVVASEVKNLAEQSEEATGQVQKILEDIRNTAEKAVMVTEEGTKGVDSGMILIEQTGEVIRGLNTVIHETTMATQQIEASIRQESAGIEQITLGMDEINQVTASFVASVNQTTEAMNNLGMIANNLKSLIDTYKIS